MLTNANVQYTPRPPSIYSVMSVWPQIMSTHTHTKMCPCTRSHTHTTTSEFFMNHPFRVYCDFGKRLYSQRN